MARSQDIVPPPVGVNNNTNINIVIIGGGVTGVLTSLELARAGYKNITLFEQGGLGNGSSSRSAACIRQQFGTPSTVRGMIYATRYYEQWREITGMSDHPLTQNGYLFLNDWRVDPDEIRARVEMQSRAGLSEVVFLTADELDKFESGRFGYLSTTGIKCATWCPTDGFLAPNIIYNDGAEAAKHLGVRIHRNSQVSAGVISDGMVTHVIVNGVSYPADVVVNATNAWTPNFSQSFGVTSLPIQPLRRYLYFMNGLRAHGTYMSEEDFRGMPMIVGPNGAYSHPTPGGELMIGWIHATQAQDLSQADQDEIEPGFGAGLPMGYGRAMAVEIGHWLPEVCVMEGANGLSGRINRITHASSGFYGVTPDGNPFLDWDPQIQNLLHAVGYSGHGLMHAPFSARVVSELIAVGPGQHLNSITLPNQGEVDIRPYHTTRQLGGHEGMQI